MDKNDAALTAHLEELAARAARAGSQVVYTKFLNPAQRLLAGSAARKVGVTCAAYGGYEDAERAVTAFYGADAPSSADVPICWLKVDWDARYCQVGHRDLLGALMALGLTREVFGDLVILPGCAYIVILREIAEFVAQSLTQAGRARVQTVLFEGSPALPEPEFVKRHDTVASLRLDAVLAAAYHLSRQDAAAMIRQGLVSVNFIQTQELDEKVAQGALLSVRGKGRVTLDAVGSPNKKGRVGITLLQYR